MSINRHLRLLIPFFISFYSYAQTTLTYTSNLSYYEQGLELFQKEKYGAAQEAFEKYLSSGDNSLHRADAEYYIAYSALSLFHKDGEKKINDFIEKYPNHPKAQSAFYELGNLYFTNKNYDKTIAYLEQVDLDQLDKRQRIEAQYKLGYSHFTKKEFDKAGKYFNALKRTDNKYTPAASYYAGYVEFRQGDYAAAIEDFKRAEKSDAYKPFVPGMIVNVYYKQDKYDELIQYASGLNFDQLKNTDDIVLLTGEAYYKKGNYPKAKEYFDKYFGKNKSGSNTAVLYRYAFAQMKTGNQKAAIDGFKQIVGKYDTLSQFAAYYLGTIYLQQGNKEFALTAFDQARKMKYSDELQEESLFNYAKLSYDLGKSNQALTSLKEFNSKYPDSSE
jgi:TolA-binding protein